jgi:predicted nucleic acid-binding protein
LLTGDDEAKAGAAAQLLTRVTRGEERVVISPLVAFEVIFLLHSTYKLPRDRTRDLMKTIISIRSMDLPNKSLWLQALDLFAQTSLSFADAYNVAYMKERGLEDIYSWDTDVDRIEGITRLEPV